MEKGNSVDLNAIWKRRCELRTKGFQLLAESDKLQSEANNFLGGYKIEAEGVRRWEKGQNLYIKSYKLKAEAWRLFAESDKLWAESILKKYGNIKMEWIKIEIEWIKRLHIMFVQGLSVDGDCNCKLETGELFEWR